MQYSSLPDVQHAIEVNMLFYVCSHRNVGRAGHILN